MSEELLRQIVRNQETAGAERREQALMVTEIRTVLLGTREPETPGLVQNFNAFRTKTSARLGRVEKVLMVLPFVGAGGTGITAYWDNLKTLWHV